MDKPATDTVVARAITAIGQKSLGVPSLSSAVGAIYYCFDA